ncbi:hypothetical protein [Wolbachia endosymbiont (group B) of Hofmannophila pseudospretella]|uniref:hypothetical protein n=1 Tax=Wolbachia endosymbiont (group B) of Hofmannophila pseudospretella TaxID=3066177 RepID=UPI00334239F5
MPFIPLYFIYFSITSFPLLSICSLYSGNWYQTIKNVPSTSLMQTCLQQQENSNRELN